MLAIGIVIGIGIGLLGSLALCAIAYARGVTDGVRAVVDGDAVSLVVDAGDAQLTSRGPMGVH